LNTLEICLFGRKLRKLYSKVNFAEVIHVKSDKYETVKFLLVVITPFSLVDLVPPFASKDGYDMFLTKHCFPFIRLLNVTNQKIKCGSSEKMLFVLIQKNSLIHSQEWETSRAWTRLRCKHDDGCNAGKWRSRGHQVLRGDRLKILYKWQMYSLLPTGKLYGFF
jgi:hypothetical protein